MSRMNEPWANSEPFGDAMPEFLRSPMTVAIGASVLAHGLFFLGLPIVADHANKEDLRPVNVVQLTPQEQAQVSAIASPPAISSSTLPPTSTLTQPFSNILPSTVVPPNATLSPTTPGLSDGSLNAPKYDPDPSFSAPIWSNPYADIFKSINRSPSETTKPEKIGLKKDAVDKKDTPDKKDAKQTPDAAASENQKPSPLPPISPTLPTDGKTGTPVATNSQPPQQASQQTSQQASQQTPTPQPTRLASATSQMQERQRLYTYNPEKNSLSQIQTIATNWITSTNPKAKGVYDRDKKFPIQQVLLLEYPKLMPVLQNHEDALVAIAVNNDGKLYSEPEFFKRTGYGILDVMVLDAIKKMTLAGTGKDEVYLYKVKLQPPDNSKPTTQPK
jgi:hypothetical protein